MASVRNASHGADVIVRTSPPVNPGREWHVEGPLSGNLALIRDVHDAWVASEMFLAGHTPSMSLPAAKIIGEYQAALEIALHSRVPISALFKDTWHVCVPLVPALWVHLLPFMPRSFNNNYNKKNADLIHEAHLRSESLSHGLGGRAVWQSRGPAIARPGVPPSESVVPRR